MHHEVVSDEFFNVHRPETQQGPPASEADARNPRAAPAAMIANPFLRDSKVFSNFIQIPQPFLHGDVPISDSLHCQAVGTARF